MIWLFKVEAMKFQFISWCASSQAVVVIVVPDKESHLACHVQPTLSRQWELNMHLRKEWCCSFLHKIYTVCNMNWGMGEANFILGK